MRDRRFPFPFATELLAPDPPAGGGGGGAGGGAGDQPPPPAAQPPANQVPYDRFQEVVNERNDLKNRMAAMEAKQRELEEKDLAEAEKLRRENERLKQASADAEAKATRLEREAIVRQVAADAQQLDGKAFLNAQDAVDLLSGKVMDLDSPEKIASAVKELAQQRPHLIGAQGGQPPNPQLPPPHGTGTGAQPPQQGNVPTNPDGSVDVQRGLGNDLLGLIKRGKANPIGEGGRSPAQGTGAYPAPPFPGQLG